MGKEITLDVDKLQQIIAGTVAATVAEMRKPEPMTAKQQADIEQQQAERLATGQGVAEKKRNERWMQEHGCPHEHPKSAGGGSHCVWVRDNDIPTSPGYILCMRCQGRFRPDEPLMRKLDPTAIFDTNKFDTNKFNLLMSDCVQTGAEILG